MRASARCPCTVLPPATPGPSKRVRLRDSKFETYSFPFDGWTAMLNRIVPTPLWKPLSVSVATSISNTSLSGRSKRTAVDQSRPMLSRHAPLAGSNCTITPTSGACSPATFDGRRRHAARHRRAVHRARRRRCEAVAHAALVDRGAPIAGVEDGGVDLRAVEARRERARRVAEQRQDPQRRAADGRTEVRRIEDPHIGARHAGRRQLRIAGAGHTHERCMRAVLAAVRRRDERAALAGAGEHEIARFVADQQRPRPRAGSARRRR